ncbi:hypothetical protein OsJ_00216 [Oryza sativa Japonica Group]|uniref:Uncharacterized protein n=1 Tax=Oryza sativa subsp. japonica TaxID=39947 RepID=B9EZA8_ORYSJ|nr:hypothetical protein OsJ_00216 [Oryza sativa Japonica Group]
MMGENRARVVALVVAVVVVVVGVAGNVAAAQAAVTVADLQRVAGSLQMYVDALPQMAKIRGYGFQRGQAVPINLTIGMYQKTWVQIPPRPAGDAGVRVRAVPGLGDVPGADDHGAARRAAVREVGEPPPGVAHPSVGTPPSPPPSPRTAASPPSSTSTAAPTRRSPTAAPSPGFTAGFAEKGPAWDPGHLPLPNVQPPGNLWYHDHALGLTRANLLAGLLGAYVIEKPEVDTPMDLPCDDDDLHLVIADRSFNVDGSLYMNFTGVAPNIHPQWAPEYFGEAITVNGKAWPFLVVHRRRYRLRILNASNARYFNVSLSNGLPIHVVGSDASYLSAPVTVSNLLLSPAEIFDVVVDFSQSPTAEIELLNSAPYPFPTGAAPGPLNGKVMKFVVQPNGPLDPPDNSTVPDHEVPYASVTALPPTTMTRYIVMYEYLTPTGQSTHLYINGLRLEDPVTETPKSGTTELWQVINLTGDNHPLHIHLGMFQAVKMQQLVNLQAFTDCMTAVNDAVKCNVDQHAVGPVVPVPDHEKTWKNVIKVPPGFVTSVILDHEDNAMIRPLKLLA